MLLVFLFIALSIAGNAPIILDFTVSHNSQKQLRNTTKTRSSLASQLASEISNKGVSAKTVAHSYNNSVEVQIDNQVSTYTATFCIGTPCQMVTVMIDSGSSEFWIPSVETSTNSSTSSSDDNMYFDRTKSHSNFYLPSTRFVAHYGGAVSANGSFMIETIGLGSITLNYTLLALVNATTSPQQMGVCGLGFVNNQNAENSVKLYSNLPMLLQQHNVTKRASYSIYLNSSDSSSGSILFGAIDHAKYENNLTELEVFKLKSDGTVADTYKALSVEMQSLQYGQVALIPTPYKVLIDTGTSAVVLPEALYEVVMPQVATFDVQSQRYIVPCSTNGTRTPFVFKFKGVDITVPFNEMTSPLKNTDQSAYVKDGQAQCALTIQKSQYGIVVLGDTFLRSAYVYVDLASAKISMAQVKYTSTSAIEYVS